MIGGVKHVWVPCTSHPESHHWQCSVCDTIRQIRSSAPSCPGNSGPQELNIPWPLVRARAAREPLACDLSDWSDEFVAGFLAGQVHMLDWIASPDRDRDIDAIRRLPGTHD